MKTTLIQRLEFRQKELATANEQIRLLKVELETIKVYVLKPIVSLQIALEKTVDCVAHVLTDMKIIKQERR